MSAHADAPEATGGRRLIDRLPPGLTDAVALLVAMRVALGLVALFAWWRGGLPGPCHFELARNGWLTIPPLADDGAAFPLLGVWQRWDACWYAKIAAFGYEPAELSVTFWPLFPALMASAARPLAGSLALGGLVVSGIAYVAAMVGMQRLVARDVDAVIARRTMLFLTIFPSAFFLFAPFTEALFLSLAVWTIAAARERAWGWAGALGALAALTRIQGVFLALPIGWEALVATGLTAWRPWRGPRLPTVGWRPILAGGLAAAAPVVAVAGYLWYAVAMTGRSPLETQDAWGGREFFPPWEVVAASWGWTVEQHDPLQALNLGLLLLFGGLLVIAALRLPIAYTLFAVPQSLLIATRIQPIPLSSTSRYLLVLFPVFVVLALIPWRRVRLAWAITSTLFLAVLVQSFLAGDFVA